MDYEKLSQEPFVVIRIGDSLCALSAHCVITMAEMPAVVPIPLSPQYVRGVVDMRGSIHSLTDLRTLLGFPSLGHERTELLAMLEARKNDHVKWLDELRLSVVERRAFNLQLDPHQCAFGQWYYSYVPPAQWVVGTLRKFEAPHNAIHQLATHVKELQAEGKIDEAVKILEMAKTTDLALLLRLFRLLGEQISDAMREICLVLEVNGSAAAFSVDAVESIERFRAGAFQDPDVTTDANRDMVLCFARRTKDESVVTVLNTEKLVCARKGAMAAGAAG